MAQMVGASEIELAENARTLRSLLIETRIIELANKRRLHSLLQHHNFSFHSSSTFSSDKDDVADEYAIQWAPIERLPAFERLRTSLFDKGDEKGKRVIDVTKLEALSDGRPETMKGDDDGRKTPVGCRPKFLRCLWGRILVRTEETPSVSGSSRAVGPDDSWIARSYLSKVVDVDGLDRYRRKFQIPEDVVLRIPESDEVACSSRYGDVAFYEADFNAGVRFPMQPLMRELLDRLNLAPGQLAPNAWRTVVGYMVMWKVLSDGKDDLTMDELLFCYKPCQIPASLGFWSLNMRQRGLKLVVGTPSSNREWKDNFVFVCGDNWEVLRRPTLSSDGHNRVLRALHHNQHHYKHFVRPELLALYSFGPEPSEDVLSLQEINQKRMATAKLNREKLKKMMMSQQDEAPLTLAKKRKTDSSSKKVADEKILPPSPLAPKPSVPNPAPTPSVDIIEIPAEPSSSRAIERVPTFPKDASLASRRAKTVVMKDDVGEYDKVNTDVIKVAGVHFLMKEALLKQKVQLSEAAQANQRLTTLVNELTLDRDRVVGKLSTLKADLTRKEEELSKALDGAKRADEQMKVLASKLETARVSAVEEFKSSEAFDDNNTKYFLSGFSFLKKQAKEKYPELDFEVFQPFDDDESMMPADDGNVGTTSADPQTDDDATS
uniref:Uncharacterized protein n=1 Tax=Fagus sylvatica TaxID=28930 RepID=A0A2N9GB78_FAGSY